MEEQKNRTQAPEVNDELIVRYLTGEAEPEEALALEEWLLSASNRERYDALAQAWNVASVSRQGMTPVNVVHAWQAMQQRMDVDIPETSKPFLFRPAVMRMAATLVFILSAILILYRNGDRRPVLEAEAHQVIKKLTLADGSDLTLFYNSRLTFPEKFDDDNRTVQLEKGEAFFSVEPDKNRPFIIQTSLGDIKVLGTSFNVKIADKQLEVEVREGLVLVTSPGGSVQLKAGMSAVVRADAPIVTQNLVHTNAWAYATRRLEFLDTPMGTVIEDLEKTYGCSFRLPDDRIRNCKLTATFENDSVDKIVHLIAETLNLSLTKDGSVFILQGEGCQ